MNTMNEIKNQQSWILQMEYQYGAFVSIDNGGKTIRFQLGNELYLILSGSDATKYKVLHPFKAFGKAKNNNLTVLFAKDWSDAVAKTETVLRNNKKNEGVSEEC